MIFTPRPPPPPPPPYGSNWSHEIADFVFLPYIYFILAFIDLECINFLLRGIEKPYVMCLDSRSDLPLDTPPPPTPPPPGQTGVIK